MTQKGVWQDLGGNVKVLITEHCVAFREGRRKSKADIIVLDTLMIEKLRFLLEVDKVDQTMSKLE